MFRLPLITLQDENDFQWLAIGAVGTLLIVVIALLVKSQRRYRRLERQAERMEQLPEPAPRPAPRRQLRADEVEWPHYGGPPR